ncbi:MAG TPA: serine/threonine-protein kinase [Polyangiaceae bacterium]
MRQVGVDTPRDAVAGAVDAVDADPRVGTTLAGKWTLDAVLGAGGAAIVYAGTHRNGNRVAVKILRPHLLDQPDLVRRFGREGHAGNRVAHPGVVKTLDDGATDDGLPYLVMERLEGESLDRRLARDGTLPLADALRIADAILDVLDAAHAAGLVHRDVKPENVFLAAGGGVKLLDFGIAGGQASGRTSVTLVGIVLGTPAFMPPEQARGRWYEVDARSDLWAVGATLFVALTGRWLRAGETPAEELASAMQPLEPIAHLAPEIAPPLAAVLDRALSHDPAQRFAGARDMQHALRDVAAAMTRASSGPPAAATTPRVPARWIAAMATVSAVAIVLAAALVGRASFSTHASSSGQASARPVANAPSPSPTPPIPEVASSPAPPRGATEAVPLVLTSGESNRGDAAIASASSTRFPDAPSPAGVSMRPRGPRPPSHPAFDPLTRRF